MNETADHESRFHDQGEHVDDPYPQQSEHPLRAGLAKIISNDGSGEYTVTEQVWTGAAWTNGTAPGQYVSVPARDYNDDARGSADDLVFFWEQYTQDGVVELIVAVGYHQVDEELATDPFTKDFWFDVEGNKAWTNVDTENDYRNRIINTAAFWDAGPPVDGGSFNDDDVYIYDVDGNPHEQINATDLMRFVNYNAAQDHLLLFVDKTATLGDFYLQVQGSTGYLQAKSENYNARYSVRVRLRTGYQVMAADDHGIS